MGLHEADILCQLWYKEIPRLFHNLTTIHSRFWPCLFYEQTISMQSRSFSLCTCLWWYFQQFLNGSKSTGDVSGIIFPKKLHHETLITTWQGEARSRSRERVHAPEARPKGKAAAKAKLPTKPPPKAAQPKAAQPKAAQPKAPQPQARLLKICGNAEVFNRFWCKHLKQLCLSLISHFLDAETAWFNGNL